MRVAAYAHAHLPLAQLRRPRRHNLLPAAGFVHYLDARPFDDAHAAHALRITVHGAPLTVALANAKRLVPLTSPHEIALVAFIAELDVLTCRLARQLQPPRIAGNCSTSAGPSNLPRWSKSGARTAGSVIALMPKSFDFSVEYSSSRSTSFRPRNSTKTAIIHDNCGPISARGQQAARAQDLNMPLGRSSVTLNLGSAARSRGGAGVMSAALPGRVGEARA